MQCSAQNFVTSQYAYGIMIAHPNMPEDEQIKKAVRMASKQLKLIKKLSEPKIPRRNKLKW